MTNIKRNTSSIRLALVAFLSLPLVGVAQDFSARGGKPHDAHPFAVGNPRWLVGHFEQGHGAGERLAAVRQRTTREIDVAIGASIAAVALIGVDHDRRDRRVFGPVVSSVIGHQGIG